MYQNARSRVRINNSYSDVFNVQVGVHQDSVLSPLLFIIVLEALSRQFQTGIQLDVIESLCYLGDKICPESGCELAKIAITRAAWGKSRELLPLLTSTTMSLARHGKLYDSCGKDTLLHSSKCWPLRREEMQRLLRNEEAMLRWILKIKADNVSLSTMYGRLNLAPLESKLSLNRLTWYGDVEKSDKCINKCTHLQIDGLKGRGRSHKTWSATVTEDLKAWNIDPNNVHDRPV